MVYKNIVFSLGHLVIFGGKPENCFKRFFLNESLINKLYEYEAIFEQLFSEKKLFDFKAYFYRTGGLFGKRNTYLESAFYKLQNGTHFNNF